MRHRRIVELAGAAVAALLAVGGAVGCGAGEQAGVPPLSFPTVLAAGDIVGCEVGEDEATAAILARNPGATVLTLGDNAYEDGTIHDFFDCFASSWGRFRQRLRPAPGDHEYRTEGAAGYFRYFRQLLERFVGLEPSSPSVEPLWRALYENDADVVLNGHNHAYERFAPQRFVPIAGESF